MYALQSIHTIFIAGMLGVVSIAGIGIYLEKAYSSHTSASRLYGEVTGGQVQPSNTFASVFYSSESTRVDLYCCTNTTDTSDGGFRVPTGHEYSGNFGNSQVGRINLDTPYTGCIRLYYYLWRTQGFNPSYYDLDGIHTCVLPDSNGNRLRENFAIHV